MTICSSGVLSLLSLCLSKTPYPTVLVVVPYWVTRVRLLGVRRFWYLSTLWGLETACVVHDLHICPVPLHQQYLALPM